MVSYTSEKIATANEFSDFFRKRFPDSEKFSDSEWCFRGQTDANWGLTSNLERYCTEFNFLLKEQARGVEKFLIREFSRNVFAYASELPSIGNSQDIQIQDILALMQHYGAPTRLIDWSYSPFIATYFALESGKGPSAVWALNAKWAEQQAKHDGPKDELNEYDETRSDKIFEKLFMPHRLGLPQQKKKFVYPVNPHVLNKRLSIQQGLFLAVGDVSQSFECTLKSYEDVKGHLVKIVIQKEVGREILKLLYRMGISRASLYPGLDGFAWSLRTKAHALREIL